MASSNELDALVNKLLSQANKKNSDKKNSASNSNPKNEGCGGGHKANAHNNNANTHNNNNANTASSGTCQISPSKVLVIAGLLGNTLDVLSVLIDRNQQIQIVLTGTFKQPPAPKEKSDLEKMLDQVGGMSFDEVMKGMLDRLK